MSAKIVGVVAVLALAAVIFSSLSLLNTRNENLPDMELVALRKANTELKLETEMLKLKGEEAASKFNAKLETLEKALSESIVRIDKAKEAKEVAVTRADGNEDAAMVLQTETAENDPVGNNDPMVDKQAITTDKTPREDQPSVEVEKPFLLTLCTMIKNDAPYVVEWIEFMRLQGVDRIVMYDDGSKDNLTLINELYRQKDPDAHVYVVKGPDNEKVGIWQRLPFVINDCHTRYTNSTKWMMIADTDEFIYAPYYGTIRKLLEAVPALEKLQRHNLTSFGAPCTIFGSSGRKHRFQYKLVQDPTTGKVSYVNKCGLQLMINNVLRGPDIYRNTSEKELQENIASSIDVCKSVNAWGGCMHGQGKTIFRPERVLIPDVHTPQEYKPGWKPHGMSNNMDHNAPGHGAPRGSVLLRCNHFHRRSYEDAYLKSAQWGIWQHFEAFNKTDRAFFSAVRDDEARRPWILELSKRMRALASLEGPCSNGLEL